MYFCYIQLKWAHFEDEEVYESKRTSYYAEGRNAIDGTRLCFRYK